MSLAGRTVRSAQELVMSTGVGPLCERLAAPSPARSSSRTCTAPEALRLPEERAFEVATINRRLAAMARQADPVRSGSAFKT